MKIISIHQPHYHPWLGLLDKIAKSHEHIVLDDVQFRKRNFQNRAQYSSPKGTKLLSLPVLAKGHQQQDGQIQAIKLAPQDLRKQFLTLKHRYNQTPGWKVIEDELENLYLQSYENLAHINLALLNFTMALYGVVTPLILSSSLKSLGQKNQKLIEICQQRQATHYLSGNGARKYMDDVLFARHGIQVQYQTFTHPEYEQHTGQDFQPGCFALDWFCLQPDAAKDMFRAQNFEPFRAKYAQA